MTGSIYYSCSIEIGITVTTDIMIFIVITDLEITINSLDTSTVINIGVGIVGKKSDISISTDWNRYDCKNNKYDIKINRFVAICYICLTAWKHTDTSSLFKQEL